MRCLMTYSHCLDIMLPQFLIVFLVCGYIEGSPRTVDPLWTCPTSPQACVPMSPSQYPAHECQVDGDCEAGARCCYSGCTRRCLLPDPCDKVICKTGYSCLVRDTPCSKPPCQKEATCVPETQVRCPQLNCATTTCPAGQSRVVDSTGCQTCQCEAKKACIRNCVLFCSYGNVLDSNGCPTCKCIPEPEHPCTKMSCASTQECRLVKSNCERAPCKPIVTCVPKSKVYYDNTCSFKDKTTVGYPVVDNVTEIDCLQKPCSDGTVCTQLGTNLNRCCWQHTQEKVLEPPKVGECPQEYMLDGTEMSQTCEIDAQCPGDQKCCYRDMKPGTVRFYGGCFTPIHKIVENAAEYCSKNPILYYVFNSVGLC
uniref:WAP domain-containing protein n=1 Tax=Biomphalaria glabrata TaxID=6526 RepID=A0A2C9LWF8_BIOGL